MKPNGDKQIQIVLIDDDDVDVEAVARLLRLHSLPYNLVTFSNGSDAKNALGGTFGYELLRRPYLILLDLNMPRMNGIAFLDELRQDAVLRRSIVFALTGSDEERDMAAAYDRRVAGYLIKAGQGVDYGSLRELLEVYYQAIEFPIA